MSGIEGANGASRQDQAKSGAASDDDQPVVRTRRRREREPLRLNDQTVSLTRRAWNEWVVKYWRQLLVALVFMATMAAATGTYPLIIKYSYDTLSAGAIDNLWLILTAIVCVTLLKGLFDYAQAIVTNRVVMSVVVDLQKKIFTHLMNADFQQITRSPPGHFVSRLTNDLQFIQQAISALLTSAAKDVLMIFALVCAMLYLDWVMTLIVLLVYPLAAIPIIGIGRRLRRVSQRTQSRMGDMTSILVESLGGARLLKTYGLERYASERAGAQFDDLYRLKFKAVESKARLNPMLEVLGGFAVAGVIALAGYRIGSGINTVGDFTGFVSALLMAAQPVRALGNLNAKLQEGLAAAQRIFALLDEKPEIMSAPGAPDLRVSRGEIVFDKASFSYLPGVYAVQDVSFTVPGGQTVALVGRSGGGKSTIMNLVPRLYDLQSGAIRIDDQDIRAVAIGSLRSAIAVVSQDVTLFNDTVRANIALGRFDASDDEIIAAARAAAAHQFIEAMTDGYDTVIGDRGLRLSGGQRQRLALARAILKDAPILLLDEATSALDTESERLVQEALATFSQGRTTLVIAHRLSTVQNADLICVMDHGRLIETGTHQDLLRLGGVYATLSQSQFLSPETEDSAHDEARAHPLTPGAISD